MQTSHGVFLPNPTTDGHDNEHGKCSKFISHIKSFFSGFGLLLTYEIIEECLEEAIAWGITTAIAKISSFLLVVLLTQSIKLGAKELSKATVIVLKPVVKKITYREGNDKIDRLNKTIRGIKMEEKKIVVFFKKLLAYLKRNIKTNTSTVINLLASAGSGCSLGGGLYFGGVELPSYAYYLIGAVLTIAMFALCELGIIDKGLETQDEYDIRKADEQLAKEEKQAQKEADRLAKEAEAEAKRIEDEALAEIERQEREAEEAAAKAAHDALVQAKLAEIQAKKAAESEEIPEQNK